MFTHKSLIVRFALILALACTGIVAASAHTALPAQKQSMMMPYPKGIPAISVPHGNHNLLRFLDILHFLDARGFVGGSTLNRQAPTLQKLQLTDILHLTNLL